VVSDIRRGKLTDKIKQSYCVIYNQITFFHNKFDLFIEYKINIIIIIFTYTYLYVYVYVYIFQMLYNMLYSVFHNVIVQCITEKHIKMRGILRHAYENIVQVTLKFKI